MPDDSKPTESQEPRRVKVQSSAERERRREMRAKHAGGESKSSAKSSAKLEASSAGDKAAPLAPGPPAAKAPGGAKAAKKKRSRGHVCPKCGKYHDVTARKPSETFDCYCGQELEVPDVTKRDGPTFDPRVHELKTKIRYTVLGTTVAAVLGTLLIFWGVLRITEAGVRVPTVLTLLVGLAFLAAAFMINAEGKRTKQELAESTE